MSNDEHNAKMYILRKNLVLSSTTPSSSFTNQDNSESSEKNVTPTNYNEMIKECVLSQDDIIKEQGQRMLSLERKIDSLEKNTIIPNQKQEYIWWKKLLIWFGNMLASPNFFVFWFGGLLLLAISYFLPGALRSVATAAIGIANVIEKNHNEQQ